MKKIIGLIILAVIVVGSLSLIFSFWNVNGSNTDGSPQEEDDYLQTMPWPGVETPATQILNESKKSEDSGKNAMEDATMNGTLDARIKLTFDNGEVTVKMFDNPTSRDFLTLLPLTLTFQDYSGTEKISYLPGRLSTEDAPEGSDPSIGDLTYYSPWGNLAIFYKDFGYAGGLVKLGTIESGIERLAEINRDFTVKIEIVE